MDTFFVFWKIEAWEMNVEYTGSDNTNSCNMISTYEEACSGKGVEMARNQTEIKEEGDVEEFWMRV